MHTFSCLVSQFPLLLRNNRAFFSRFAGTVPAKVKADVAYMASTAETQQVAHKQPSAMVRYLNVMLKN